MNHRSLAFRLTVWYTLLLSVTFALVGAGLLYGLEEYLRANLRDSLRLCQPRRQMGKEAHHLPPSSTALKNE